MAHLSGRLRPVLRQNEGPLGRFTIRLSRAAQAPRRFTPCAALSLLFGTTFLAAPLLPAQTATPQQPAAPIVRPRPRPQTTGQVPGQTSVPVTAPPDAAPLTPRVPRPHPINPQALSGATGASGSNGVTATVPSHPRPAATGLTRPAAAAATGPITAPRPKVASTTTAATTKSTSTSPAATTTAASVATTAPPKPQISATGLNRAVIVLDPSHGGTDSGSRIGDNTLEKNVTLALAFRLRSLLIARGFTVALTRDSDTAAEPNAPSTPLTLDDRAGIANHNRAAACLLLHATGRGNGVHLYTSDLQAASGEAPQLPWLTAQAAWVPASQQLERSISTALGRSHISLVSSTASVRPVDSLTCPALVLELAPENDDVQSVNDAAYQERVAAAIAGALVFWQNQVQPPPKLNLGPLTPHVTRHHAPSSTAISGGVQP